MGETMPGIYDKQVKQTLQDAGRLFQDAGKAWPRYADTAAVRFQAGVKRLEDLPQEIVDVLHLPVHTGAE